MVWIETPSNPLLKLVDIQGASEIVHQHEVSVTLTLKVIICHAAYTLSVISLMILRNYLCSKRGSYFPLIASSDASYHWA